jgi:hypothetical protein
MIRSFWQYLPFSIAAIVAGCSVGGMQPTDPPVPSDDAGTEPPPSAPPPGAIEGGGVYHVDDAAADPALCPATSIVHPGCMEEVLEGQIGLCDQVDNDCDGEVDESCPCTPGDVQRCFKGPPGRRGLGACSDGQQTCVVNGEFGIWGACEGGHSPSAEACDGLDNDCNGCMDELGGDECVPTGTCPAPGDPRIPDGAPFSTYELNGGDFYEGSDAVSWHWSVVGSPCDRMFQRLPGSTATSENGQLSYTLHDADSENASLDFTLSGDYEVTLTVERSDGSEFTCTWIVPVRAPGIRVELCWDATGPTASTAFGGTVDVDLHLARMDMTTQWFDDQDCHYTNCKGTSYGGRVDWGYADTPLANCTGPGARGSFDTACPNPRLDIDNVAQSTEYVPENINLDNPNDGDEFRVMVHHYSYNDRVVKPIINVYCGGELRGSYGTPPDEVTSFDSGGGRESGDMWRVVDIETSVSGGVTDCMLSPITPPGRMTGYYVTTDDISL